MVLVYTDSQGHRQVIAQHIATPEEALPHIMNDAKSKFNFPKGKIAIQVKGMNTFNFSANGKDTGYALMNGEAVET